MAAQSAARTSDLLAAQPPAVGTTYTVKMTINGKDYTKTYLMLPDVWRGEK
jgi:hypothetical protein